MSRNDKTHWIYFLPDCRPTLHVVNLLGQITGLHRQIEDAERRIADLERQITDRVQQEYSFDEVAEARRECLVHATPKSAIRNPKEAA